MPQRETTTMRREAIYAEAMAILDREVGRDVTVDALARRLATSRRQLQRVLAELGDTTFREALTHSRMSQAAALLRATPAPVSAIADAVGFADSSQFCKAFKRRHGVSPVAFRKQAAAPPSWAPLNLVTTGLSPRVMAQLTGRADLPSAGGPGG